MYHNLTIYYAAIPHLYVSKSVRNKGFATVDSVETALAKIFAHYQQLITPTIKKKVSQALHYRLAQTITAKFDAPNFRRSAMDGFAIFAEDVFGATESSPITLEIVGLSEIGDLHKLDLRKGQAIRISTGAPVPDAATGVIKLEDTAVQDTNLVVFKSITPGKNIAEIGEDLQKGTVLFKKGHRIRPYDISQLFDQGITEVVVHEHIKVGIFSSGNELLAPNESVAPALGTVYDSNRPGLIAYLQTLHCQIVDMGIIKDEESLIIEGIKNVKDKVDVLITTGGTSVGNKDYMPDLIRKYGSVIVHGVGIRPGKPFAYGEVFGKPIIMLPGYPLAAFLNFELFAVPLLRKMNGYSTWQYKTKQVYVEHKIASREGYRDFVRLVQTGEKDGIPVTRRLRLTGAGILSSLTTADYLLEVPEHVEGYPQGSKVTVRDLSTLTIW